MSQLYIGLMSGTSADGIDAAIVDFSGNKPTLVASLYTPHSAELHKLIIELCHPGENEIERLGTLDTLLGKAFADAALKLLKQEKLKPTDIAAIGCHGQTVRHIPPTFTLQIGDPNIIAAETGITTIADFRRRDMALGGQGAPLAPAFHDVVFGSANTDRVVVNIGGFANITLIPKDKAAPTIGFDTGPGNVLMDYWVHQHQGSRYDENGAWAKSGKVNAKLLSQMKQDPYFTLPAPKSTGREYFHPEWLNKQLAQFGEMIEPQDAQATLNQLTAETIVDAIKQHFVKGEIYVCGGGAQNGYLMQTLQTVAGEHFTVDSTETLGVHPDWMEAIAFAWLAKQTLAKEAGNLPSVTGAKQPTVLGGVYFA